MKSKEVDTTELEGQAPAERSLTLPVTEGSAERRACELRGFLCSAGLPSGVQSPLGVS